MSANTPGPAQIAGYTDETFPDEIYFPRLRSMGLNTAGGNSSWKWHEGKIPYTYQIKTGLAPISEADIVAKGGEQGFIEWMQDYLSQVQRYANDPYCMGFVVDNELNISGGDTMSKDEVERIYFKAVREALNYLSDVAGRPPMIMFDPASNDGYWMAYYSDVLSMHRMEGYYPATWKDKFDSLGTWGIDRPVGQFTFTMGNMDVGVAHYGLTMFLNQRNRAQGVNYFMRKAYEHPNNIAIHMYAYMKTTARPLTEYRFLVNKTDTTDYFLADYVGGIGDEIYRIHMGVDAPCSQGHCEDNRGFDFSVTPALQTVEAGGTATYNVFVDAADHFTHTVTLSSTAPSPDIEMNLSPAIGIPPFTATLTLTDRHGGTIDSGFWYTVPFTATADNVVQSKTIELLVNGEQIFLPQIAR